MVAVTSTASLALASGPVRAVHAGVNSVSGTYNSGAAAASAASGVVFLCKIPVNATVLQVQWYHSTGATAHAVTLGIRDGATATSTLAAILSAATQGVAVTGGKNLPYDATGTDGEQFKYVVMANSAGSATTSLKAFYTVFYTMDK